MPLLGRDRLLVLPFDTRSRWSAERRSLDHFVGAVDTVMKKMSLGRYRISGRVAPHHRMGTRVEPCMVEPHRSWQATRKAAKRRGFDLGRFDYVVVFAECTAYRGEPRWTTQPGKVSWIYSYEPASQGRYWSVAESMLHNAGLGHDSGLACRLGDTITLLRGECRVLEGKDPTSMMGEGGGAISPASLPTKHLLGWSRDVKTVRSPGTHTMVRPHGKEPGTRGLRIIAGPATTYWVEPTSAGSYGLTNALRLWRETPDGAMLLRTKPGFPGYPYLHGAIPPHGTVTTPEGVRIRAVPNGLTSVVAEVTYGAPPARQPDPVPGVVVRQNGAAIKVEWGTIDDGGAPVRDQHVAVPELGESTSVHWERRWARFQAPRGTIGHVEVTATNEYGESEPTRVPFEVDQLTPQIWLTDPSDHQYLTGSTWVSTGIKDPQGSYLYGEPIEVHVGGVRQDVLETKPSWEGTRVLWDTRSVPDGIYEIFARTTGDHPAYSDSKIIRVDNNGTLP